MDDKYIVGVNSSGKTRQMLEQAKRSGAVVVCKHPLHMQNKANSYGIFGLNFVSYEGFLDNKPDFYGQKIAIDEIGDFIMNIFGVEVDAFTMTID